MKRIAAVFIIIIMAKTAMSQFTFEKVYDFWDDFQFFTVYPVHDGYILSGTAKLEDYFYFVMKTDFQGDTVFTRKFYPDHLISSIGTRLIPWDEDYFYLAFSMNSAIFLQKLNMNGETVWIKKVKEDCWLRDVKRSLDGNLIFMASSGNDLHLFKCATAGNVLYEGTGQMVEPGTYNLSCIPTSMAEMPDGKILAAVNYIGMESYIRQTIFFFDSTCNYLDIKEVPTRLTSYPAAIQAILPDENEVLVIGLNMGYRFYISRLTNEGDTLWVRYFLYEQYKGYFNNIVQDTEGNYVMAGMMGEYLTYNTDLGLFCFSAQGDSLWWKIYRYEGFETYVQGISLCTDGGIAVAGHIQNHSATIQKGIFLRTDSQGSVIGFNVAEIGRHESIKMYPNPAKSYINVSGIERINGISVMDISGREVFHPTSINPQSPVQKIDLKGMPSGIYFIKVETSKVSHYGKFILLN